MQAVREIPIDIFEEHRQLLGRPLDSVLAAHDGELELADPCGHLLETLAWGTGKIPMTFTGIVGDSGQYSAAQIAMLRSHSSRSRMTQSEHEYLLATRSREVARQYLSRTICHTGMPMATAVGLDNRVLLPPFFPGYRNQDGIFVATLKRCVHDGYLGHVPCVLPHARSSPGKSEPRWSSRIRISQILIELICEWPGATRSQSVSECLVSLGRYLVDQASYQSSDFRERVRLILLRRASRLLREQDSMIQLFSGKPEYWARDLEGQMEQLREAVVQPGFVQPQDVVGELLDKDPLSTAQDLIKMFGQLLTWWPAIVESARDLARHGADLGTPP
jgi:hypothetical protein